MSPGSQPAVLRWLAAAAAAAGLGCTLWAARAVPAHLVRIDRREADLRSLANVENDARALAPYLAALTAATGGIAETPEAMLRRVAPGAAAPTVAAAAPEPLDDGWRFRRYTFSFADVPVDSLSAFLAACDTARPPWRAAQVRIQALDPGSTRARAALTLEGVDRAATGAKDGP